MQKLPLGISDFKEVIEENYAYVDKSLLIQELMESGSKIALIPRMRRFGKTLNLSMLRYFFEKTSESRGHLFHSLKIWQKKEYRAMQGQFPVIFFTLKDIKHSSWQDTFNAFRELIANEFDRHSEILESLTKKEKEQYHKILSEEADQPLFERSLHFLTTWLHRHHNKRVILLIDEYDSPAHNAFTEGYYKTFIDFLRNWLSSGLKDNSSLEKGVLTGILRIAKESIFSGLNNVITYTLLSETFQDKFGLLESEVKQLLENYSLVKQLPEMRKWYNGYRIGLCEDIYNPWSVLNSIDKKGALAPYWVNTSNNDLIRKLLTNGTDDLKADLEELLRGGIIEKTLDEGFVFSSLEKNTDAIWSLLLFSGYLTLAAPFVYGTPCLLRIPNFEVTELYQSVILDWFKSGIHLPKYHILLNSLVKGEIEIFKQIFEDFLISSVSVFDVGSDEPEKIYHAFILGMLIGLKDRYEVKSNRESGYGRYDVMLIPKNPDELGIVMEFKKVTKLDQSDLETAANSALKQIKDQHYTQELLDRGIKRILLLALAFQGKKVSILHEPLAFMAR